MRFRRNGKKLRVVRAEAEIYHYGWVRPPKQMKQKQIALDSLHHDIEWVDQRHADATVEYEYGTLKHLAAFKDTHLTPPKHLAGQECPAYRGASADPP